MAADYEWDIEVYDECGDVADHSFAERLSEFGKHELHEAVYDAHSGTALVLVRDGDDREWAYAHTSTPYFPSMFNGGSKVPRRFIEEFHVAMGTAPPSKPQPKPHPREKFGRSSSYEVTPDLGFIYNEGGRADHFKGYTGDCVTRSIAIAMERPYIEVYDELKEAAKIERPRRGRTRSSVRDGVARPTIRRYMAAQGWTWVPTMAVGQGCSTHLFADELPSGRLVVSVSKHITTMLDGVIHDTHDPRRYNPGRCVYGYWHKAS